MYSISTVASPYVVKPRVYLNGLDGNRWALAKFAKEIGTAIKMPRENLERILMFILTKPYLTALRAFNLYFGKFVELVK